MKPNITVVGSINMDLITTVRRFPNQGQTLYGEDFMMKPGGKGANQAVAAARLGANVNFIGKIGKDPLGYELKEHLIKEGIHVDHITLSDKSTGIANVLIYERDNRIIYVPGANNDVTVGYVLAKKESILQSDFVVLQMEIPIPTIIACIDLCNAHHIPVILNPAPAKTLPEQTWEKCTFITPNEEEASELLLSIYQEKLITTLGSKGTSYMGKMIPSFKANVLDTTGAGDTFNGALAYYLSCGEPIYDAIEKANAAASIAIEALGAQNGMPTRSQVEARIQEKSRA